MTSPRNKPQDPAKTIDDLMKNFRQELRAQHPDYEALVFTSARIQRIALEAIAAPLPDGDYDAAKEFRALKSLAHKAIQAVGYLEDYLSEAWRKEKGLYDDNTELPAEVSCDPGGEGPSNEEGPRI